MEEDFYHGLLDTDWTLGMGAAVDRALAVAASYSHFAVCFQAFHKDRYAAEMLARELVRFTAPGTERDRQVSAYQKGHRPQGGPFAGKRAEQPAQTPRVRQAFEGVLRSCLQTGARSFSYGEPWDLWRELLPEYMERVKAIARRAGTLSLGDYRLDEFNAFYAVLIAVCAAHEHLCFRWGEICRAYPTESAVMVHTTAKWTELLSELSGIAPEKCEPCSPT